MTSFPVLRLILPVSLATASAALAGCEGPNVDGATYACTTSPECGAGFECVSNVCVKLGESPDTAGGDVTSDATTTDATATDATATDATATDATATDATTTDATDATGPDADALGCRGTWDDPTTVEVETQNVDEECQSAALGECKHGTVVCVDGTTLECHQDKTAVDEVCNDLDDNCDGDTDEGFGVGDPCDGDDADLCAYGVVRCSLGDPTATTCDESQAPNQVEVCDGEDNDCDLDTDEDFGELGTVRTAGQSYAPDNGKHLGMDCGTGVCAGGTVVCSGDLTLDCTTAASRSSETCNGLDDDCDGLTDEDFDVGQGCDGPDGDSCAGGLKVCKPDDPTKTICDESGGAAAEICDGLDNDCDTFVDEAFKAGAEGIVALTDALYAADNGKHLGDACGVGACAGGTVACNAANRSRLLCQSPTAASAEICDGVDNDCDGQTDEDFGSGGSVRLAGSPYAADNGKYKGQACGAGGCASGTVVCGSATTLACSTAGLAADERCNAFDDDCDGQTDDGFPVGAGCDGLDADSCAGGSLVCDPADGTRTICNETAAAAVEVCDGVDNDCDTKIDEDFKAGADAVVALSGAAYAPDNGKHLGEACGTGVCAGGAVACNAADRTKLVCQTSAAPSQELCDGLDNDCDGATDEDFLTGGTVTYAGGGYSADAGKTKGQSCGAGACVGGTVVCKDGTSLTCSTIGSATTDVCNAQDDDCDGSTDEDYGAGGAIRFGGGPYPADANKYKGQSCGTGLCAGGTVVCSGPNALTCGTLNKSVSETCNTVDDNCNGQVDDGITRPWYSDCDQDSYYTSTGTPFTGCSAPGSTSCPSGLTGPWSLTKPGAAFADCNDTVATVNPAATERCNGLDDDCSGTTDLNALLWVDCDGDTYYKEVMTGACTSTCASRTSAPANGVDCDDTRLNVHPNGTEVCVNMAAHTADGVDDDCDLVVDDGCPTVHKNGTGGLTWGPGQHLIIESMSASGITVQAGATVYVAPNASFRAGYDGGTGRLTVNGTQASPVVFKGDDRWTVQTPSYAGEWVGIDLGSNASGSTLSWTTIQDASIGLNLDFANNVTLDGLTVKGCADDGIRVKWGTGLVMTNLDVNSNGGHGLELAAGAEFLLSHSSISGNGLSGVFAEAGRVTRGSGGVEQVGFHDVTIKDNGGDAIVIPTSEWGSIDALAVTHNGTDVVRAPRDASTASGTSHWRNLGIPFRLGLSTVGPYNGSADLTIDGGTVIEMAPYQNQGAQLVFGNGATTLQINNARELGPVVFRVAPGATLYPGTQLEIWFSTKFDFANSNIDGLTVEDGTIIVYADSNTAFKTVTFKNVTVTGSDYSGIQFNSNGLRAVDFENVVASYNSYDGFSFNGMCTGCGPMRIVSSVFSNNGHYGIQCPGGCTQYTPQWSDLIAKDNTLGPYN